MLAHHSSRLLLVLIVAVPVLYSCGGDDTNPVVANPPAQGTGTFPAVVAYDAGSYPRSVFAADLDGD